LRSAVTALVAMLRASRWIIPSLVCVLLAAFGLALWGSYRAAFPGKGLYRVSGVFQARAGETMFLVKHDPVPGLMDEMSSMALFADSADLLDRARLEAGDHVRLTIRQTPDRLLVVEIQKIP